MLMIIGRISSSVHATSLLCWRHSPAFAAFPEILVFHPVVDNRLQLCSQICTMEGVFSDNSGLAVLRRATVPPQTVNRSLGSLTFDNKPNGACEPDRIMWGISRQEEHLSFFNPDVSELSIVNNAKGHSALVLIEPFLGLVDMIVISFVRATDHHDSVVRRRVEAKVVDRWFQEV